jgi:hypothetical protein
VLLDTARTWWSRQDILLRVALSVALLVLLVNVTVTAYVRAKQGADRGVVPIYEGSCAYVRNTETIVHIFINIISTLLLGASNLCMQILAAPTREQIDKAHSKQQWLDIVSYVIDTGTQMALLTILRSRVFQVGAICEVSAGSEQRFGFA